MPKRPLGKSVYDAAIERLHEVFDECEHVYVSFSGGKDSGVLLNLAIEVARERGRLPLDVLTVDLEAQYAHTVSYVKRSLSRPEVRPHWVCLPLHLRNAVSQVQPHWLCWNPAKEDAWVRPLPDAPGVVSSETHYPFFYKGMEFEDFVPEFGGWIAEGRKTCCLVGIRSDESLNRFRTLVNERKETLGGRPWTTRQTANTYTAYPIYDWRTEDVWAANGKFGWDYNEIYDLMHLAGVPLSQQRLCQPYGDDQRKGLYLFRLLEPETWIRVVTRVEGANFGCRYSKTKATVFGNFKVSLPPGHTYESYANFLLDTMPPYLAAHYRKKIDKFFSWWYVNGEKKMGISYPPIPDAADPKMESQRKVPSWRRIVKVLLKNDYWAKGLSFNQTKREMDRQLALIASFSEEK